MNSIVVGHTDILEWLKRPFPCPENWYQKIVPSFSVSIMIFFILLIFRPFGISSIEKGVSWFISGYCFITLYVMLGSSFLGPLVFKDFFDHENWTIGKYLIHIFFDYFIGSFFAWIYTITAGKDFTESLTFVLFLWFTFSVSLFPVLLIVFYYERIHFKKKLHKALYYSGRLEIYQRQESNHCALRLVVEKKSAEIFISTVDLICARANGNYSLVHYYQSGEIRNVLIRMTLTMLEKSCREDSSIVRCHRSALVNLLYASKFSGNARNYFIHVDCVHLKLNISRTIPSSILEKFRKL